MKITNKDIQRLRRAARRLLNIKKKTTIFKSNKDYNRQKNKKILFD